ncbi:DUF1749-domain-containing protein [Byssothecium circinans]|uniref:DUF1749-domain-containing protein n=1 Tax=Byssothecium circinans TaxID=147558 RepID=A0A6A5TLI7_9PLEO|nr:DUF1749-domain-containing protein [Byssothecium circinans]
MTSHSPSPFAVTVHPFASPTPFSCAYERGSPTFKNALVFIGGLTSGPHTTDALHIIFKFLTSSELNYSLWEFRMRSSYTGFGHSSLANDAEDISALVTYLRGIGKQRIVLLGMSTGCQGIMEYANTEKYTSHHGVDAYILTSPVSDRETASMLMPPNFLSQTLQHAESMIADGNKDEIMPKHLIPPIFTSPISAYRWHSLISRDGDDDYFSSDLSDSTLATTFGRLGKPTLITMSQEDEMVPETVDKEALLGRWKSAAGEGVVSGLSGVNPGPGADHAVSGAEAREWWAEKVVEFLGAL